MIINGINYPVIGKVKSETLGKEIPILDIPMMSDEKWRELTNTPEQIERRKHLSAQVGGECHG